jgi:hypothetical protein
LEILGNYQRRTTGTTQALSGTNPMVTDCSHYVVFAIKKNLSLEHLDHFIARTAEVRGITVE